MQPVVTISASQLRDDTVVLFRRRLDSVMARSGLTPAGFARLAGLDRSTLSQLMTDQSPRLPRAETLVAIAGGRVPDGRGQVLGDRRSHCRGDDRNHRIAFG